MSAKGIDWVDRAANAVVARLDRLGATGRPIVCASGISPSGPVHLGNLRELMVPHFVAEELRRRGYDVRHRLYWDDLDRLRKVPAGTPDSFGEFIGRALTDVPDPSGQFPHWAERWKVPLREALVELKMDIEEVGQTARYRSGDYADLVSIALRRRAEIDATLARFRTLAPTNDGGVDQPESGQSEYWPYRSYCDVCGHDDTEVVAFDPDADVVTFRCRRHPHEGSDAIREGTLGKLVWKVDWPMRWRRDGIDFEAGGDDHSSPGSSYTVGTELVRSVFGGEPPEYIGYSFVGVKGMAKLSGSRGGALTPADALAVLEPRVLRWMYARREPRRPMTIDLGAGAARIHDEWDALERRQRHGVAGAMEARQVVQATETSMGVVTGPGVVVPFQTLASVVDVTAKNEVQMLRVLSQISGRPVEDLGQLEPRLSRAHRWLDRRDGGARRTCPRTTADAALLAGLPHAERDWLDDLIKAVETFDDFEALTNAVYAIPKVRRGLDPDAVPDDLTKKAQRRLFELAYKLLIGEPTGPRLPTLLLALGSQRVRVLLGASGAAALEN
jgi:lysyl-tRNA synthetase class 1